MSGGQGLDIKTASSDHNQLNGAHNVNLDDIGKKTIRALAREKFLLDMS